VTRIFSSSEGNPNPRIEKDSVARFFRERAQKVEAVGAMRAVIYQDKHPDLAEKRDAAEKARLLPLLQLDGNQRTLDVGCGTGRWTPDLAANSAHYHGIDFSVELVEHALAAHPETEKLHFSVAPAENYSLTSLHESQPFDRILCCGVMIYLNDEDVENAFRCMASSTANKARIVLREPVGISERLTIKEHFSDELEQNYNAIYRTQRELKSLMRSSLFTSGFRLIAKGDVYEAQLNNRAETIQRWFVLERA
jgi:cyclopropane fatty-acyl-phospholipid synthase-like methyltransferase